MVLLATWDPHAEPSDRQPNIRSMCPRSLPSQFTVALHESCQSFCHRSYVGSGVPPGLLLELGRALVQRELVATGCITFFTAYSPILCPISVPTRVEKR
jgi:hypothetical protein